MLYESYVDVPFIQEYITIHMMSLKQYNEMMLIKIKQYADSLWMWHCKKWCIYDNWNNTPTIHILKHKKKTIYDGERRAAKSRGLVIRSAIRASANRSTRAAACVEDSHVHCALTLRRIRRHAFCNAHVEVASKQQPTCVGGAYGKAGPK